MIARKIVLFLFIVFYAGCGASVSTQKRDVVVSEVPKAPPPISLIPSDAQSISDQEIHRILSIVPSIPTKVRIAVVHLRHESVKEYYEDKDIQGLIAISPTFINKLKSSPQIDDVAYLPAFLLPASPSIGQLREAAARYQADLVILYASSCKLYPDYGVFSRSEARAYCYADATALDVRTGLLPFVSRSGDDITIKESDSDIRLSEVMERAETEGIDKAMTRIGEAFVQFLSGLGTLPTENGASTKTAEPKAR